jgi:hypothetical protein
MRKFLSFVLVTVATTAGTPHSVLAAEPDSIGLTGTAFTSNLQPLSNAEVQIRNFKTGVRVNSMRSDTAGQYSFSALQAGTYIVEIVDASGRVLGMTAPFVLGAAPNVRVSVVAVAQGLATASPESAGFSLFGLGPVSSLAVIGAAGAAAVTGVVATRPDASPSR